MAMSGSKIGEKPEKKILNPQEKLAAINRVNERGESKASVARDLGIPESTLRGWCKNSLRINYQSSRSSPDTDDALKLSPTPNGSSNKRKSLLSTNSSCKKRGRRPNSPNITTNQLLMTGSTLTELNRLKSEYGLSRTTDYLTQSSTIDSNTSSLDAAMRGWALQMQMLLQASMATSSTDISSNNHPIINPLSTQNNITSSSLLTNSTNNATSNIINQLWAESTSTNNPLYPSTLTTPSTSSTLPLNLNFPTTSNTNLSQISTNSLLMSYLPTTLMDTNLNQNKSSNLPTTKNSFYQTQTQKYPWRTNSPNNYMQNYGSSASSSGSMSPKSRGSTNQGFNDLYYGTDEEAPALTNLSQSNEETSSDSIMIPKTIPIPMDFSNHPHTSQTTSLIDDISKSEFPPVDIRLQETTISQQIKLEPKNDEIKPEENKMEIQTDELKSEMSQTSNKSSIEEDKKDVNDQLIGSTSSSAKLDSCTDGHRKNLESVLASVFQVTNNNTIVSLDEEQKVISITEAIECGEVFLKFLETAKDPNVTASQITQFKHILGSIKAGCSQKNNERKPKVSRK
ncbi:protein distal antenna-like [Onthophagus taurus]|uniref:protein distal antenna-like n=1 Tax=Onthophagus taurus TaxID=166361 RepID=UPI0039BE6292